VGYSRQGPEKRWRLVNKQQAEARAERDTRPPKLANPYVYLDKPPLPNTDHEIVIVKIKPKKS
jgi:hypothetical protein